MHDMWKHKKRRGVSCFLQWLTGVQDSMAAMLCCTACYDCNASEHITTQDISTPLDFIMQP